MITKNNIPFEATHPGTLIRDELDARGDFTQRELALLLGVKPSFLNEIINGKRPVTADIAVLLETALGISADYWMKFQMQYEIDSARIKEKNILKIKQIEQWNLITQYVPVNYFYKKGQLTNDLNTDIATILDVYAVHSVEELIEKYSVKMTAFQNICREWKLDVKNLTAWTSEIEYLAEKKNVNTFQLKELRHFLPEINELIDGQGIVKDYTEAKLAQYGIKFLSVENLANSPIVAYLFWSKDNPVIALTSTQLNPDDFSLAISFFTDCHALHPKHKLDTYFIINTNDKQKKRKMYIQESSLEQGSWNE